MIPVKEDIYEVKMFYENDDLRLKLQINKSSKIVDVVTMLRRKTKYPSHELFVYRVKWVPK